MRKSISLFVIIGLMMALLPAAGALGEDATIREQNHDWLLKHNPDYDSNAIVDLHTGDGVEQVTAAEALARTLDRAGNTLLSERTTPAVHDEMAPVFVGYIWIIGTEEVDCGRVTQLAEVPFAPIRTHPDLGEYIWRDLGYTSGVSASTYWIQAWTISEEFQGAGPVHYGGNTDFFCVDGPGLELLFPFINGYAVADEGPLPYLPLPGLPSSAGS